MAKAASPSDTEELINNISSSGSEIENDQVPRRKAQPSPSTLEEALACVANAKKIVCIVGAGISTNSGIPDFRSPDSGLYAQIAAGAFGQVPVSEPQELFDINIFRDEPELFYSVAGSFLHQFADAKPSPAHAFLAKLASAGVLQRVYTQNIDGLEAKSGVPAEKVVQCHGSLDSAMCASCNARTTIDVVHSAAAAGKVARCTRCRSGAIKPSVVFFHEALPKRFYSCLKADIQRADLVLVMGSSMRVAPVSRMLSLFAPHAAAVLVNRDRVTGPAHQSERCRDEFDVELLGDADLISDMLLKQIHPKETAAAPPSVAESSHLQFRADGRTINVSSTLPPPAPAAAGSGASRGTKRPRAGKVPQPPKPADVLLACAAVLKRSRLRKPSRKLREATSLS